MVYAKPQSEKKGRKNPHTNIKKCVYIQGKRIKSVRKKNYNEKPLPHTLETAENEMKTFQFVQIRVKIVINFHLNVEYEIKTFVYSFFCALQFVIVLIFDLLLCLLYIR